jgi:hypothetical protein
MQKMNKKLAKHLKKQTPKSNKKRSRDQSDSEPESDKDFESDNFHLDLEETSFNDDDLSEIDWANEEESNDEADE